MMKIDAESFLFFAKKVRPSGGKFKRTKEERKQLKSGDTNVLFLDYDPTLSGCSYSLGNISLVKCNVLSFKIRISLIERKFLFQKVRFIFFCLYRRAFEYWLCKIIKFTIAFSSQFRRQEIWLNSL